MLEPDPDSEIRASCDQENYAAATRLILKGYGRRVRSYLSVRTRDPGTVDEVFSVFSEDIWRGLPGFRFQCKVQAWVFAVARNALCRYLKSRRRWCSRHVPFDGEESQLALRPESDGEHALGAGLTPLIAGLAPADRCLLEQRLVLSLGFRDIALDQLNAQDRLNEASVQRESARLRKRYQLVVKRLRVEFARAGASLGRGEWS